MMETIIGQVIDNYKILEVLGRGGMGVVFKAVDLNLEKIVAVKMIDPYLARDETFLKKFKTEAKALAKIEDKNIVSVYALRENTYGLFMVMEYVKARTLSEWIRENGKFTNKETIAISKQIIHAINCAHNSGVIHRDIKPNNVLLCDDRTVKVMDFGLAKVIQDQGTQQTRTQVAAGTLHYMAPEQIKGFADKRSDIYSIGITIYEMLTGRTPFEKTESEYEVQNQIVNGKIPSPLKYNPNISRQLVKIIMKSVDKDIDKRYQSLNEMLSDLNNITIEDENETLRENDKTKIIGSPVTKEKEGSLKLTRNLILAGSGVIILVALFIFTFLFSKGNPSENNSNNNKTINNIEGDNNIADKGNSIAIEFSKLTLTSNPPGASIFIDNKQVGKTPLTKDSLIPQVYSISMKMDGYETWSNPSFNLKAGDNPLNIKLTPVSITPIATASLTLKMDVPGSIYLDGVREAANSTEFRKSQLAVGSHKIRFDHPQFGSKETTVNLTKNQKRELSVYYYQKVNIQSLNSLEEPFWGTIYINNKNIGETTPHVTTLGPGRYEITVKKTGFNTREKTMKLDIQPLFESKTHLLVFHLE